MGNRAHFQELIRAKRGANQTATLNAEVNSVEQQPGVVALTTSDITLKLHGCLT
jgi:hypothetical protein